LAEEPRKVEWQPWVDPALDPASVACQLRLNALSREVYRRPLWTTEADWADRLRDGLAGLDLFVQLFVVREYALRDRVAIRFGEPRADTAALDELLGLQPWRDTPGAWLRPRPSLYQMQERGAAGSALFDWLVRSLLGVERQAGIDWRGIVRVAHGRADYKGSPWSLSDALFPRQEGQEEALT
jgi:hypothetical protein